METTHQINDEIIECGLFYCAHFNHCYLKVVGTSWSTEIPLDRIREFIDLFPDLDWEDGEFLHKIIGRYIRVTYTNNLELYALHHITKNITYLI